MTSKNFARLAKTGDLKAEPPIRAEFEGLLRVARTQLADARRGQLAIESRFNLAYEAAHASSLAALRWHGYRSENRYIVFQCLSHTLGVGAELWRVLSLCHDLRNSAMYRGQFDVDEKLLAELLSVAETVLTKSSALPPPK